MKTMIREFQRRLNMMRYIVAFMVMLVMTFNFTPHAAAGRGCSHDCRTCHSISKDEVSKILNANTLGGNVQVVDVKMAAVKGIWEIIARQGFKTGIFYLDFEKRHLIYGAIVGTRGQQNLTKASFEQNTRVRLSDINKASTLLLGKNNAATQLYIFADPTCSHCSEQHKILKRIVKERSDIAFQIVLFPLKKINPGSYEKASTVYCAKSLRALEDSYTGKPVTAPSCELKGFDDNIAAAEKYGITGTPTTVFPDGSIYFGNLDQKSLLARLDKTGK